ncbi:MAG: c-type cytochrome, partial [Planctomycetota bacterium]
IQLVRKVLDKVDNDLIDPKHGRRVFAERCGSCHRLFGEGTEVGPDLTGSNRDNLGYLLENIVDPSRVVPAPMRQSAILLVDGRVITGTIVARAEKSIEVRTVKERVSLATDEVERIKQLDTSLMPEGLLDNLGREDIAALFAYLQSGF